MEAEFNHLNHELREIVHEVANGRSYTEVQGGRWGKRARAIRERNAKMAQEYRRRELACELRGESVSFSVLAARIGRLPEFNLRRSAAIAAIRAAGHSGQSAGYCGTRQKEA